MEEKNIYQQTPAEQEHEGQKFSVDLTMAQARRKTIWSMALVLLGGAMMLVAVIYFILPGGKEKSPVKEPVDQETEGEKAASTSAAHDTGAALLSPELDAMTRSALAERDAAAPPESVNPQQAAEAMGELRQARQYYQTKEWDKAEEHTRNALKIYPSMNAALRLLGFIHLQRGQFDQAIAVLEEAQSTDPFNAETFNNLATAYMQRADMEKAEELLLAAIEIQPDYTLSYLNLGLLYLAKGEYQLALNNLEQALPSVPDEVNVRNNLAVSLLRLGRYQESRDHFQIILNQKPDMAPAYFNTAITYVLEGNEQKAMEWIEDGAQHCSPSMLKNFLNDTDFDPIRNTEPFQYIMNRLSPQLPTGPGSAK